MSGAAFLGQGERLRRGQRTVERSLGRQRIGHHGSTKRGDALSLFGTGEVDFRILKEECHLAELFI